MKKRVRLILKLIPVGNKKFKILIRHIPPRYVLRVIVPGEDAECCRGNEITGQTGRSG